MANRERLIELLKWAKAEDDKRQAGLPSEWDQNDWFQVTDCGTTCCIAGKAVLMYGLDEGYVVKRGFYFRWDDGDITWRTDIYSPDGQRSDWESAALELLGVSQDYRLALFGTARTLWDLIYAVAGALGEHTADLITEVGL